MCLIGLFALVEILAKAELKPDALHLAQQEHHAGDGGHLIGEGQEQDDAQDHRQSGDGGEHRADKHKLARKQPITWKTVNLLVEVKALVILGILLVTYLLSKYTGLFVIGAVFCALGFLAFFRCRKRSYYIITLALAVGIWCAFRFGLGVSF